MEVMG